MSEKICKHAVFKKDSTGSFCQWCSDKNIPLVKRQEDGSSKIICETECKDFE